VLPREKKEKKTEKKRETVLAFLLIFLQFDAGGKEI